MQNAFQFEETDEQIGILTFDLPGQKVNKFSTSVMHELDNKLDELSKKTNLKSLLLRSGKSGIYIAGADIDEIDTITTEEQGFEVSRKGQAVFCGRADGVLSSDFS